MRVGGRWNDNNNSNNSNNNDNSNDNHNNNDNDNNNITTTTTTTNVINDYGGRALAGVISGFRRTSGQLVSVSFCYDWSFFLFQNLEPLCYD